MKIEAIEIYRVNMPLIYPFRTAFGNDAEIQSVLVKMVGEGQYGWGEAASWRTPAYSPECAAGQFLVSRDFLAPLLIGRDIASGEAMVDLFSCVKGNQFAKAGFDLAWWDLFAKLQEKPLWELIGGKGPVVDAGADFGIMESVDLLLKTIERALEDGYKRVKLKYRPGWGVEMVRSVRKAFPEAVFHVDCNSAYTLADTAELKSLDEFNLAMIEQPLNNEDLIDHARLRKDVKTPICLDESINSPARARKAIEIGACDWINIKPGRVGGLTNAMKIHDIARNAGIPCWIGGMLESAVGESFLVALATLPNIRYPSDIFPTDRFYKRDLGRSPMVHSAPGQFTASEAPGVGAEPDFRSLERLTVERATVKA